MSTLVRRLVAVALAVVAVITATHIQSTTYTCPRAIAGCSLSNPLPVGAPPPILQATDHFSAITLVVVIGIAYLAVVLWTARWKVFS